MICRAAGALVLTTALALVACSGEDDGAGRDGSAPAASSTTPAPAPDPPGTASVGATSLRDLLAPGQVTALVPEVVATVPHDPEAFTQGLEEHDGVLLESTGRYGRSERRRVDPATGQVLASSPLPAEHFGEGLTVVGDRVIQLTWREGVAHVADAATLAAEGELAYEGEGWGLCLDGDRLIMSDGTATLQFRDPATFAELARVEVTHDDEPVPLLNELECADGLVWANVWGATEFIGVDPASGEVLAVVDAAELTPDGLPEEAVLNGIARRPGGETFWLTGKLWPVLYEVRLVPTGQP